MNNNDILIRLRYALDIKDSVMVEIFKLGGVEVTQEEVSMMLIKSNDNYHDEAENEGSIKCSNSMLDSFLNGFIIFKRGQQDPKTGQAEKPALSIKNYESVNNILLKK